MAFTVSLSPASSDQVTVAYATSGGTATSGTDFTAASGTLTFAANETSKTVSVETTDDSDDEENETFTLTLSSPTNATLGDSTATGTINDDDGEVVPLTAEFQNVPAAHDGSTAFTLRVLFSEDLAPGGSGRKLARALTLKGATAGTVRRVNERRDLYEFPVQPSGTTAVTVSLSATTDCAADDAVCTADGKALSQAVSVTVAGPGGHSRPQRVRCERDRGVCGRVHGVRCRQRAATRSRSSTPLRGARRRAGPTSRRRRGR